ncbi:MAG: hypothetical protein ABIP13_04245, partial [Tepidiformaceae bacterium]
GAAAGWSLTDTLPTNAGLAWSIDSQTPAASCSITAGVLHCPPTGTTTLAAGATVTVHITSLTPAATCGSVVNTATVSATNEAEGDLGNNSSGPITVTVLCGTIQIIKIDQTVAGDGRPAQWNFNVTSSDGPFSVGAQIALGGGNVLVTGLAAGNYSVAELAAQFGTCPVPNAAATYRTTGETGSKAVVAGQTTTFTYTNLECGIVLSTGALIVHKYSDTNGNHIQDAGEIGIAGWSITVKGPEFPAGQTFQTDATGTLILPGIKTGTYTVSEETRATYTAIGVLTDDSSLVFNPGGTTTTVDLAFEDTDTVTFFNQPRSSVRVVKTQVVNLVSGPGAGWTFTLSGCGITPIIGVTGGDGTFTFSNLPPAIACTYTVAETTVATWVVTPSASQSTSPAAGQQTTVRFTNTRVDAPVVCDNCVPIPTPTPTNTPTPTATPTNPPTATPTRTNTPAPTATVAINIVQGEKTPGPQITPLPPRTGDGVGGQLGSFNILLAVLGLFTLAAGLLTTVIARKRQHGE